MPQENIPALLLGEGLTLLGAVRCFGRAGIPAFVASGPDPLAGHSRWFQTLPRSVTPPSYSKLAKYLRHLDLDRAVLVPCSDLWADAVSHLDAETAERFPSVISSGDVIDLLIDKGRFAGALEEAGIPHPETHLLENGRGLEDLSDRLLSAAFLKPRNSAAFVEVFGTKALDFQSRSHAVEQLQRAEAAGLEMLLQEYIPGGADQHYFIDGFVDRSGACAVLFARRRLRIYPPRFGNSTAVESVPLEDVRQAVASIKTLAASMGLRGIFSAEFKRDERDGLFKLLEVNPRPWWYLEFAATCGADVCEPAYRDALGLPVAPAPPYRVGVRLIYPVHDWLAWWRDSAKSPSLPQLLGFWAGATQPTCRLDDPLPAVFAVARQGKAWIVSHRPGRSGR